MITAITPTGDRLFALTLCQMWMEQQTVKPDQWIVVDDGKNSYRPGVCDYIRRTPRPDDPEHTLNLNMIEALKHVKGDLIVIIEDDEYYAPRYIETIVAPLREYEIVGIGWSKYYHFPSKGYAQHANIAHASWAQTAFRSTMIPIVRDMAAQTNQHYLDVRVWRTCGGNIVSGSGLPPGWRRPVGPSGLVFHDAESVYVGMKGLPGRGGIGIGHRTQTYKTFDTDGKIFEKWIIDPDHRALYERMIPQ